MRALRGAAALLTAATLALAACTSPRSDGTATESPAGRDGEIRAATEAMSTCLRANGVPDLPDMEYDEQGMPRASAGWDPAENQRVRTALEGPCREHLERLQALAQDPPEPPREPMAAADLAKVRQYADCMRTHGFPDFPDSDQTGRFDLPPSWPEGLGKGDRPEDRQFLAAVKACERFAVPGMEFG